MLGREELTERARLVIEKPFGLDLESAPRARRRAQGGRRRGAGLPHRPLPRQGGGAEHPGAALRQRPLRAGLGPQQHRASVQIDVPEDARHGGPRQLLRVDRLPARHDLDPPVPAARLRRARGPGHLRREGACATPSPRSSRSCGRSTRSASSSASTTATATRTTSTTTPRSRPSSPSRPTSTTTAGAACPFYLRTGKTLAESNRRTITLRFRTPASTLFDERPGPQRAGARAHRRPA